MGIVETAVRRARDTPSRLAYRFIDKKLEQTSALSHAELDTRAREIARRLLNRTSSGARVVIALPTGPEFVVALFGALYAGRIAVPALAPQPRGGPALKRLCSIISDARPEIVVGPSDLGRALSERGLPREAAACRVFGFQELAGDRPAATGLEPASEGLALLQYTSGSTADPKGVMLPHDALEANLEVIREQFEHDEQTRSLCWLPLHHDMGLIGHVFHPMHVGFPMIFMSPSDFAQRPGRWLQAISRYRIGTSGGPPFALRMCLERVSDEQLCSVDLSSWRVAFVGAERVPASLLDRFAARFAPRGLRASALRTCYGLAEATLMVCAARPSGTGPVRRSGGDDAPFSIAGSGRPVSRHDVVVVDSSDARCPDGETGEILVRGPSVGAGYWNKSAESERTFAARCGPGAPYLRTGDRGFFVDGELFVVGRVKDLMIVRGQNHIPEDVEATASASHGCLRGATGAAFSIATESGERPVVVQEVARRSLRTLDIDAVSAAVVEAVAREHGFRIEVVLVTPGRIPRTTSGKVQRGRCRELYLSARLPSLDLPTAPGRTAIATRGVT